MFEGIVSSLLNKYLGKYIQGLDADNLSLGLLSGELELLDLKLKPEALAELDLPLEVKAGYVGKIKLDLPLTDLFGKPVKVVVEDVFMLAGPVSDREYDPQIEEQLQLARKLAKLDAIQGAKESVTEEDDDPTFFEKLAMAIVKNIQVEIRNIHIRYEDTVTNPNHPFAFGITLTDLSAFTTDSKWRSTQAKNEESMVYKIVKLNTLSIYWNPYQQESSLIKNKIHTEAWRNLLKQSLTTKVILEEHFNYILRPVSAQCTLVLNKSGDFSSPKLRVNMTLDDIDLLMSRQQFLNVISLVDSLQFMAINEQFRKYAPTVSVKGNASQWWKYAYTSILEEYIRPYSWERIKQHRAWYKQYKQIYKKKLEYPDDESLDGQLVNLTRHLDVVNIILAQEQAKLEFEKEAPDRAARKRKEKGWFWSWWSSSSDSEDELGVNTGNRRLWDQLSSDEKEILYSRIGYTEDGVVSNRPPAYVEHAVQLELSEVSLTLSNFSENVLRASVASLQSTFENRPGSDGFRVTGKAHSLSIEGASADHEMVSIITSDIGSYAPDQDSALLRMTFDVNPVHVEADFALDLGVQRVEIVYDEHAVSQVISFFHIPNLNMDEVKAAASYAWERVSKYSLAGLQYAVQTHKTIDLSVDLMSPYVVVPEHGTLQRGGNVVVVDFGHLKVRSELQPKIDSLEDLTRSEIEARLYDKFVIDVTDVKVLLADSGDDWHTAQSQEDSQYHIVPCIKTQISFFNTAKPDYTKLPQQKLEANLPTLKLQMSDQTIVTLYEFFTHLPLPVTSPLPMSDSVDGLVESTLPPVTPLDKANVKLELGRTELQRLSRNVGRRKARKRTLKSTSSSIESGKERSASATESEHYYSASDHSDEDIDEWARAFELPSVDDHSSTTNIVTVLVRVKVHEVLIQLSKFQPRHDEPYLQMWVNRLQSDIAVTTFGLAVQAKLGGVRLVDKLHTVTSGQYLELLSSTSEDDLIHLTYRQVSADCPDFETIYKSISQGALLKLSKLSLVFDRQAAVYLLNYGQALLKRIEEQSKSSTVPMLESSPAPGESIDTPDSTPVSPVKEFQTSGSQLHLVAQLGTLDVKLCNAEEDIAVVEVRGLDFRFISKKTRNIITAVLQDISVNDLSEDAVYSEILDLKDDNVFDAKFVTYNKPAIPSASNNRLPSLDFSLRLRVGRFQAVLVYKFINDITAFVEPFVHPTMTETAYHAANDAVVRGVRDMDQNKTLGKLSINIRAPTVLIPQSHKSRNLMVAQLGYLTLMNDFVPSETNGVKQLRDVMYLNMESVKILRALKTSGANSKEDSYIVQQTVVEPIKLGVNLKRLLTGTVEDSVQYEVSGRMEIIKVSISKEDIQLILAIIAENFRPPEGTVTAVNVVPLSSSRTIHSESSHEAVSPMISEQESEERGGMLVSVKFVAHGIQLTLLDVNKMSGEDLMSVDEESYQPVSMFTIKSLGLDAGMTTGSEMNIHVTLETVHLDDVRSNSKLAIKRLIQTAVDLQKDRTDGKVSRVIDFHFSQSSQGNQTINASVEKIRLNLCVPYFLWLYKFIMDAVSTSKNISKITRSPELPPAVVTPDSEPLTKLTVNVEFKEPEVVLFADPSVPNSKVLVLKAVGQLDYSSHLGRQEMVAKIVDLSLLTCVYGNRKHTAQMVLLPCNVAFNQRIASVGGEVVMDAAVEKLQFHISPAIVHMVLDIVDVIQLDSSTSAATDGCHSPKKEADPSFWHVKEMSGDAKWKKDAEDVPSKVSWKKTEPACETLSVNIPEIIVIFELETLDNNVPMVSLQTSLEGKIHDWSKQLQVHLELHLQMNVYNEKLDVWQPLIEPVMEHESSYRPWEVLFKLVQAPSHRIACTSKDEILAPPDAVDGLVHHTFASHVHSGEESSENETDPDTEMTIIRRSRSVRPRNQSEKSDALSHHSDIQGESDSDSEASFLTSLTSAFSNLFSDDDDEDDGDEADVSDNENDDTGDDLDSFYDQPVFLTSLGPVNMDAGIEEGYDTVDGDVETDQCWYMMFSSRDQLLINITPSSMDVIMDIINAMSRQPTNTLRCVANLPQMEFHNQLGVNLKLCLNKNTKVNDNSLYNCVLVPSLTDDRSWLESGPEDSLDEEEDTESDVDEPDSLGFLQRTLSRIARTTVSVIVPTAGAQDDVFEPVQVTAEKDKMNIQVDQFDALFQLPYKKEGTFYTPLSPKKDDSVYCVVYQVNRESGQTVVTFRSPLQVYNHLSLPVEVYAKTEELNQHVPGFASSLPSGEGFSRLSVLESGDTYDVPLLVAYHCKLYLRPAESSFLRAVDAIWCQELGSLKTKDRMFVSLALDNPDKIFNFKVVYKETSVSSAHNLKPYSSISIHIHPPVVLHNYLPYDLHFSHEGAILQTLACGEQSPLYGADVYKNPKLTLQVLDYMDDNWSGSIELTEEVEEFKAISMEPDKEAELESSQLSLSMHTVRSDTVHLHVYSPYWLVNKTGLPLEFRGSRSDAVFGNGSDPYTDPVLFRYKKHKRKKCKLRVYNTGKWSSSFCLDTVGSSGVVICHNKERKAKYQFLLHIVMSKQQLTKIITICPFFLVINKTEQELLFMEEQPYVSDEETDENADVYDLWLHIKPGECLPYWPLTDSMKMFVKYADSAVCSSHFPINKSHSTILRMNKGTALSVAVAGGTESSITVTFEDYQPGDAPVRVENLCEDAFIKIHQKNQGQVIVLSANQSVLYTWDDPTAERTLMWNVYNSKKPSHPAVITKDASGEVKVAIQTVRRTGLVEHPERFIDTSMLDPEGKISALLIEKANLTVSTITTILGTPVSEETKKGIESSSDDDSEAELITTGNKSVALNTRTDRMTVFWTSYMEGHQRVLLFTQDERIAKKARKSNEMEQATVAIFASLDGVGISLVNSMYQEVAYASLTNCPAFWQVETKRNRWKTLGLELSSFLEDKWRNDQAEANFQDYVAADLLNMQMTKPFEGALRRVSSPAIWCQYWQSLHHYRVLAKIHRLQVDNQLPDAYFPTVLHPTPLPGYILRKTGPKPFIEMALLRKTVPENNVDVIKYFKVLIQEFSIKLDKGFILSAIDAVSNMVEQKPESVQVKEDVAMVKQSLAETTEVLAALSPDKIFYEYLHLSPLKMKVSFSLQGQAYTAEQTSTSIGKDIVDFFLNSIGVTLTEIREVEIRLAYFEQRAKFQSQPQLLSDIRSHYTSQAIQQAYVLILGLDVLGNPYGLVKDFTKGFGDFFYEPFMGSITEPDEVASGITRGVMSLFGHTVGGAAGSAALITGSVGRALATLSFDADYKKKRQQRMIQQPKHLPQSIALAGKTLVMGIGLGLSGVVTNPVRGVQEEGVEGFFKGIGKGLLGLITKPTGGIVDMVSLTFDGIRRAAEMGQGVVSRVRLPRYINPNMGLRPYSPYQAGGNRILADLKKGAYVRTDIYWAHVILNSGDRPNVLMVTNNRLLHLMKSRLWGGWSVDWEIQLTALVGVPAIVDSKMVFKTKTEDDDTFSLFTGEQKVIECDDHETLVWLQKKIQSALDNF